MSRKTDVLIIGGGVIGACSALWLARAGKQVTLVEKADICAGASLGNACWVAAGYAIPTAAPGVIKQGLRWMFNSGSPFSIKPRLNLDLLKWLWAFRASCTEQNVKTGSEVLMQLNLQSLEMFRELASELDFDFHEEGILHLHLSEKYKQAGEAEAETLRALGLKAISLQRDGLLELEPNLQEGIESGIFFPQHAHLDPKKLVEALAQKAEQEGVVIQTQTDVTGFELSRNQIKQVKTSKGIIEASEVVLAAGAWPYLLGN